MGEQRAETPRHTTTVAVQQMSKAHQARPHGRQLVEEPLQLHHTPSAALQHLAEATPLNAPPPSSSLFLADPQVTLFSHQ